ncbi:MAG: hypothetical protein K9N05_00115 [Candidatus Marinimicrobia bacterium]|nr:hypothetical protein [Candidatus Neomarinimicrobiota bacterium]
MILLHRFDDADRHCINIRHRSAMLFHHSAFTKHGFHPFLYGSLDRLADRLNDPD